jgi:hypothetical protein
MNTTTTHHAPRTTHHHHHHWPPTHAPPPSATHSRTSHHYIHHHHFHSRQGSNVDFSRLAFVSERADAHTLWRSIENEAARQDQQMVLEMAA